ncbi:hypothetical protein VFPPC_17997 [Pochonia chlamydosporia 170]|uniref:Uncharacterized protein n=1 Tax=Pochonia chlamydosporia 170 TaxID=1380566 RepID=A0A219AQ89_METCM|nr:hypothetical protein VFPPC_17997 [Pochonia chlamydosporia 170]OWT42742.1 hypothetical protein VFPPC_17997 [Pochonia chlamydosporia 170]
MPFTITARHNPTTHRQIFGRMLLATRRQASVGVLDCNLDQAVCGWHGLRSI